VLSLADPELGPEAGQTGTGAGLRGDTSARRLGRLPAARQEAAALVGALGGRRLIGSAASKAALVRGLDEPVSILHLAAHARIDASRASHSALMLAPVPGGDGRLVPAEIAGLPLEGKIVVLSGCRTGSGRILGGEGPMSLARAFFQAGARSVLASLWPLRDAEAARWVTELTPRLAAGRRLDEAVREVRRELRREGLPAEAWAGIALLGEGDARVGPLTQAATPDQEEWRLLAMAGAASGLAALSLSYLRRRRAETLTCGSGGSGRPGRPP
jgi:CHAT domain-containing protein